jgi:hypothetical protein
MPKKYTTNDLVAEIIASEKRIRSVELHFDDIVVKDNRVYSSLDWGYEGGKQYYAGKLFPPAVPERNIPAWQKEKKGVFDGEKFYSLGEKTNFWNGQVIKKGWAGSIGPDRDIFGFFKPTRLLGYEIVKKRPVNRTTVTLGELLRSAQQVSLRVDLEEIDGHLCIVAEAIGAKHVTWVGNASGVRYEDCTKDVRVWIDTQRDFRPLRIETYTGDQDPLQAMGRIDQWQVLNGVIENTKLEKIDGIWFPTDGITTGFSPEMVLPRDKITEVELKRLSPDQRRELVRFTYKPSSPGPRRMRVYKDTVQINKGIDPKKFRIEFPEGCEVWDDFRKAKFIIGQNGEDPNAPDSNSPSDQP